MINLLKVLLQLLSNPTNYQLYLIREMIRMSQKADSFSDPLPVLANSQNVTRYHLTNLERFLYLILISCLILAYPAARVLPAFWSWENGPFEWTQVCLLLAGGCAAWWWSRHTSSRPLAQFWSYQTPVWLVLLGRETSWGAAFFPYQSVGPHGPVLVSSKSLWYGPVIDPLLGLILIFIIYQVVKYRLYRIPLQLFKAKRFPVLAFGIAFFAIIMANCAEKDMFTLPNDGNLLLEEYFETLFYLGLLATTGQIRIRTGSQPTGKASKALS